MKDARVTAKLRVNGVEHEISVQSRRLLSDVLRDELGLTGTHVGCEHGVCGACTVLLDGTPARACLTFAVQVEGTEITTVEALAEDGRLHPLQEALQAEHGLQCGFCTPGILMTFVAYLRENPEPTEADVRDVLSGNLCRCTGYQSIVQAMMRAARAMNAEPNV